MNTTVKIALGQRSYEILIGENLLLSDNILPVISGKQVLIVTNTTIKPLYLERMCQALSDKEIHVVELEDGEQYKNMQTLERIFDALLRVPCDRRVTLVALGGGVIGDITGFAAACYQRGVPFVQIPTTLLAQVDSSVGGKTAVNHPLGKNMIGAFYQPKRVIADLSLLKTLPAREFSAGMAEVIKYGLIADVAFFNWLEDNIDALMQLSTEALGYAVKVSCQTKARIVEKDEMEQGVRAILNLGHTFGHAIETGLGYGTWLHGEAVAMGMLMAAHMSHKMGMLSTEQVSRIRALLEKANLPVGKLEGLSGAQMLQLMGRDKKVADGAINLILMRDIGDAFITSEYEMSLLQQTIDEFIAEKKCN